MTYLGKLTSIRKEGLNKRNTSYFTKISFEQMYLNLLKFIESEEYEKFNDISGNIIVGKKPKCGTSSFFINDI